MRLKLRRQAQHRANNVDRIVQTPTMACRPFTGDPAATQLMAAVPDAGDFLTRELPAVSPAAVLPPYPHTAFTPMSGHPAPPRLLDATQVLPVIREQRPIADSTTTQILPRTPAALSPSAQHVNLARQYYQRTFVEDNDLDPQSRGRHVLEELKAEDSGMPDLVSHADTAPAVQGAYGRVVAALAQPDSLAGAVRIARRAHAMFVARRHRLDEDESRLDVCWRRIEKFNADWDRQIRDDQVARHGQRAVVAGEELAAAYEGNRLRIAEENARRVADGKAPLDATATTFTRGMAAKIQQMLVSEAKAGSVGVR